MGASLWNQVAILSYVAIPEEEEAAEATTSINPSPHSPAAGKVILYEFLWKSD